MFLSKPSWTNWESFGNEAGVALVSTQEGATCVRHALGKGIFEHLEKTGCYDGCTKDVLELMQTRIIELVEAIFPDKNPIDPYKFDGKSVVVGRRIVKMKIDHVWRNKSSEAFANDNQLSSFLRDDGSNFWISLCDAAFFGSGGGGLHAVYVKDYNVDERTFFGVNSWGPDNNPYPSIRDDTPSALPFHVYGVHLMNANDPEMEVDLPQSTRHNAPSGQQSPTGTWFSVNLTFPKAQQTLEMSAFAKVTA